MASTAILALVTAPAAICVFVIVPCKSTVATVAINAVPVYLYVLLSVVKNTWRPWKLPVVGNTVTISIGRKLLGKLAAAKAPDTSAAGIEVTKEVPV